MADGEWEPLLRSKGRNSIYGNTQDTVYYGYKINNMVIDDFIE